MPFHWVDISETSTFCVGICQTSAIGITETQSVGIIQSPPKKISSYNVSVHRKDCIAGAKGLSTDTAQDFPPSPKISDS